MHSYKSSFANRAYDANLPVGMDAIYTTRSQLSPQNLAQNEDLLEMPVTGRRSVTFRVIDAMTINVLLF
jgi:hypothetical protein